MNSQFSLYLLVVVSAIASPLSSFGQNEDDALRISSISPGGTARSAGMANSFGALGAEPGSLMINPAGMGLYRRSELSLTPSFEVNDATSTHYGTKAGDTQSRMYFSNLALVLNDPNEKGGGRHRTTYGVVYSRQATNHWRALAQGISVPSTILQTFANEADGTPDGQLFSAFPFTSGLAWDTYGIDPTVELWPNGDTIPNTFGSAVPFGSLTDQQRTMESRGASSNTSFFYSGSLEDQLYWGVSVGIAGHRFKRTTIYTENALDENLDLRETVYREDLNTTGNGLDVKFGIIARVSDRFRAGASFHSPQWMQLSDTYFTSMQTRFRTPDSNGNSSYSAESPDGVFSYRLNTPWRGVVSAAYLAGKNGLVNVDYEYADFRQARFRPSNRIVDDYDFAFENSAIRNTMRGVHSIRVGTEWRQGSWYYRLGWGFSPDAHLKEDPRHGFATKTYAGGLGYRTDHIGVDFGLNYVQASSNYYMYDPSTVDPTREERRNYRAMITVSFRN